MNKEKLQQLAHLIAGLLTISYGLDIFEKGDLPRAAIFLGSAIIFMIIAGLHKSLSKKFMQGDVAFFLLEALAIFYAGYNYKVNGKNMFYYAMLFIGVAYVVFAILSTNRDERPNKNSRRSKHKRRSGTSRSISTEDFLRAGNSNVPKQ